MEYAGVAKHHAFCPITTGQNKAEYVLKCQSVYVTPYHIDTMKIEHIQGTVYTVRTAIESESPMMTNRMFICSLSLSFFLSCSFNLRNCWETMRKKVKKKTSFLSPPPPPRRPVLVCTVHRRSRQENIYLVLKGETP